MADDRLFHIRAGHSMKVNALTPIEEIAWEYCMFAADDFGVMPFEAIELQRVHHRLKAKYSAPAVQRMLEHIRDVGLILTFEHQERVFCFQRDWQDFQKIRYPLKTIYPRIPSASLAECSIATQWLHTLWPGSMGRSKKLPRWQPSRGWQPPDWTSNGSGNVPGTAEPTPVTGSGNVSECSGTRATRAPDGYGGEGTGTGTEGGPGETIVELNGLEARAERFVVRYAELFEQFRGGRYVPQGEKDRDAALSVVRTWDDARLDELVEAFLTTDEDFCRNGNGSIAQFRSRASWCDSMLVAQGL